MNASNLGFSLPMIPKWWTHFGIIAVVTGCTGRIDSEPLPVCASPVTEGFDPVIEEQERFDAASAVWTGDLVAGSLGNGVRFEGDGVSTTPIYLNRGYTYAVSGSVTSDTGATVTLVQTTTSGYSLGVAVWEVQAGETVVIGEDVEITDNGALAFSVRLDAPGSLDLDLTVTGHQWADVPDVVAAGPVLVGFLLHLEDSPLLLTDEALWDRRQTVMTALSQTLAAHGAVLNLQPGATFTEATTLWDPDWFAARQAEGMMFTVHVHNESEGEEALEKSVRTGVNAFEAAGIDADDLNGGFQLGIWQRLAAAGLHSLTAFKNPATQLDLSRPHVNPWRPADGTGALDEEAFGVHDPDGPLVYLPGSGVREADHGRFGEFARGHLAQVREHASAERVNTWYFIEHVDGFGPPVEDSEAFDAYVADGLAADMAALDAALTEVIDPLVAAGEVGYSDPNRMREAFDLWEHGCL